MKRERDLTQGNITSGLWAFAVPLMLGNVMQQLYNLADTWVVGRYIGENALAAVGSSYTLITFLTSIIIGLSLGCSSFVSMAYGKKDFDRIRNGIFLSFSFIAAITVLLMVILYAALHPIIGFLQVPEETRGIMYQYLFFVLMGFFATFLYNYFANILRGIGNAMVPLLFLGISVVLNIFLDVLFVAGLRKGIAGAAVATVIAQHIAGFGILIFYYFSYPEFRMQKKDMVWKKETLKSIVSLSGLTCIQQSVMNFGILMVQGIVNMPVQDFGNAFSVFVAQNFGAGKGERIQKGMRQAVISIVIFCLCISSIVFVGARPLMHVFVGDSEKVIQTGVEYLRIEGAFYIGIGILFMLYGYYRAVNLPMMSVVLTVISLGTRVVLAYVLSRIPAFGVVGIWVSIPIGWFLADAAGILYMKKQKDYFLRM